MRTTERALAILVAVAVGTVPITASADASPPPQSRADAVRAHWTPERIARAIPRDFVVNPTVTAATPMTRGEPVARGKPSHNDTDGPTITNLDPAGTTISAPYPFRAQVTDDSGVRSVTFDLYANGGATYVSSFAATNTGGSTWTVQISNIADGQWRWDVHATDTVKRGNTSTASASFTVASGDPEPPPPPPDPGGIVTNRQYTAGGEVQTAVGRIYFEMRASAKGKPRYLGYVCSGTVVQDGTAGRSIIITASHCVYDDAAKEFARNVLFIPDQAGTTGTGTDSNCDNDPLGCWAPNIGVVDNDWSSRTWPANIAWDHAFYVAAAGSHTGATGGGDLDVAVGGGLPVQFGDPTTTEPTTALGYSYSDDPNLMFCRQTVGTDGDSLWLSQCGLSGGASGGPWINPLSGGGTGPIVSVNSYGYGNTPGMGGPHLGGEALCLFEVAKTEAANAARGTVATC